MKQTPAVLCYLGILSLICFPASSFPQTNEPQHRERRNDASCRPNQFQCKSGLCVMSSRLCDGTKDCDDGSDETCNYIKKSELPLTKECGNFDQKLFPLQQNGSIEGSGIPWFATVSKKFDDTFNYICSGSIVSSRAIISGAICIYDEEFQKTADPSLFKVIVGRYIMKRTPTEQQFKVESIHMPLRFKGHVRNLEADIAVLLLENKINFNEFVSPICLDLKKIYSNDLTPGKSGIIGGWDGQYINGTLKIHSVPYIRSSDCEEKIPPSFFPFITSDKFCSGIVNVSTVCRGDNGAGFATQRRNEKWYLVGIVSVGVPSKSVCNSQNYYALTDVSQHYDFLEKYFQIAEESDNPYIEQLLPLQYSPPSTSVSTSPSLPSRTCKLPKQPEHGQYKVVGVQTLNIDMNPGHMVPGGIVLIYTCHPDYILRGSSVIECSNDWSPDPPICSKIQCSPLNDSSREIDCSLNGKDVACMDPAEPGTRATLRCKTHFENVPTLSTYSIVCEKRGIWSKDLHPCVPKCGEPNPQGITLISDGQITKRSEYPWHIGLYKFQEDGSLNLHCSGTLVSLRVIVTAAHCFPEDTAEHMENVMSQYRVVAGKYYRDWNKVSKYTQHLEMEQLALHRRYRGGDRNYINDIAVIVLKYQVRIDEAVCPVCVDFDKSFSKYLTPGITGIVIGWGLTKNQTQSDVLLSANLSYVSHTECENNTPPAFHDFLLGDKFCAGKDETTVCQGDSGGGYAVKFSHLTRWYLVGVVSVGVTDKCGAYPYAAFTSVYSNLEFIKNFVDEYY